MRKKLLSPLEIEDHKDIVFFATNRLDKEGNFASIVELEKKKKEIEKLASLCVNDADNQNLKEIVDKLNDEIEKEKEIETISKEYCTFFKKSILDLKLYIQNQIEEKEYVKSLETLTSSYKRIKIQYKNGFKQLVDSIYGTTERRYFEKRISGNYISADFLASIFGGGCDRQISCTIGAFCDTDTQDCGFFDGCDRDVCGAGDSFWPCNFYDSGTK